MLELGGLLAAADLTTGGVVFQSSLILALVVLSGLFSGSEAVLFSLTPAQIQQAGLSDNPLARLVPRVMARPKRALSTILVANTAVNVALFSASYVFFARLATVYGEWITPVSGVISILLVVVLGEVVPKVLGVALAPKIAPFSGTLVRVADVPVGPIGRALDWLVIEPINRLFFDAVSGADDAGGHELQPDELKTLLEMNRRTGVLAAHEDDLLREVIDLGDLRVRDVMVPRVEVVAFDINGDRKALIDLMRQSQLKKLPVYEGEIDRIVGMLYAKVVLFNPDESLQKLVSPIRYVPELISCEQVLAHFRDTRSQLAIAVDEYGGVAGLVTLEDVLEEIVGEIRAPGESVEQSDVITISETEYDISGSLSIHFWAETFGLPRIPGRIATVGGFIINELGRPARVGDVVTIQNVELEVTAVQRRRVTRVRLRLLALIPADEEAARG